MLADPSGDGGIDADELERFSTRLLTEVGAPEDIASEVAESLVLSDLRGHNSHGTRRIPSYAQHVREGRDDGYTVDPAARSEIVSEGSTYALVDGRNGFGQVSGREAVDVAVEKASEHGVSMVGIRDATHLGRIGEWSERAAADDMLFAAYVYNHGRLVAPPGSAHRRYSTNPISYGIPTFDALDFPIMLDIATSQIAGGKTGEFQARSEPLSEDWTVTHDGGSVTDAGTFRDGEGALLPLGGLGSGYKGFGLAMVAELFGGIVSDAPVHGETDFNRGCAAMFVAADPTVFTTRDVIEERITALRDYIAATEFSPHVPMGAVAYGDRALLPGEPEHLTQQARGESGIPLPDTDVTSMLDLAADLGVSDVPTAFEDVAAADD